MSKVFVIPDVHLKPWMFSKASELIEKYKPDDIVSLGDLIDDWGEQYNVNLYKKTLDTVLDFARGFPQTKWCIGNHDISYIWRRGQSGYSYAVQDQVTAKLNELYGLVGENAKFVHKIDDTLFSHAGITDYFIFNRQLDDETVDEVVDAINAMGQKELWQDDSPIWARLQILPHSNYVEELYHANVFQVVGHTPVEEPLEQEGLLTLDTFSTHRDKTPYGNQKFVIVDTVSHKWEYAE